MIKPVSIKAKKKQHWNTFNKRIAINNDLDYEETISSIREFLEPI